MSVQFAVQNNPISFTVDGNQVAFNAAAVGQTGPQGPVGPAGPAAGAIVVTNLSSSVNITASDNSGFFTNLNATAAITATLPIAPSPFSSLQYTFFVAASYNFIVAAQPGMTIQYLSDSSTSGGNFSSSTQGTMISISLISATQWLVMAIAGTWDVA